MDIKTLNIPPEVKREIEEFAAEVERRNRGEVPEEEFKRFRLQQGIYGQRQDEEQMVRTKLPLGQITSEQLSCLAEFGEKYSHGILHVTTRQDIQFHYVKINTVPQGLQDLADHGLTTREACGNTVRNVTARLDRVGDQVARLQREAHSGRSHRHTVADPDGVESEADEALGSDTRLDSLGKIEKVHIAGVALEPNTRNADLGFPEIGGVEASAVEHRLRGSLRLDLSDLRAENIKLLDHLTSPWLARKYCSAFPQLAYF